MIEDNFKGWLESILTTSLNPIAISYNSNNTVVRVLCTKPKSKASTSVMDYFKLPVFDVVNKRKIVIDLRSIFKIEDFDWDVNLKL